MIDQKYKYALMDVLSRYPMLASILFDKDLEVDYTVPDILFVPPNKIKVNVKATWNYNGIELSALFLREAIKAYLAHPFIYNIISDDIKKLAYLIASNVYVSYSLRGFYSISEIGDIIRGANDFIVYVLGIYPADKIFNYTVEEIAEKIYVILKKFYDALKKLLDKLKRMLPSDISVDNLKTVLASIIGSGTLGDAGFRSQVYYYFIYEVARAMIELYYLDKALPNSIERDKYVDKVLRDITYVLQDVRDKAAGCEVAGIVKTLKLLLTRAKVDWRSVLATVFIHEGTEKYYYTYSKINRKLYVLGIPLPGKATYGKKRVIVAIDTSGSITDDEYLEFANEVCHLVHITNTPTTVVMWEANVVNVVDIKNLQDAIRKLSKRVGGGGTFVSRAIEWIKNNIRDWKNSTLVILTDGYFFDELTEDLINGFKKVIVVLSKSGTTSRIKTKNVIITWLS